MLYGERPLTLGGRCEHEHVHGKRIPIYVKREWCGGRLPDAMQRAETKSAQRRQVIAVGVSALVWLASAWALQRVRLLDWPELQVLGYLALALIPAYAVMRLLDRP